MSISYVKLRSGSWGIRSGSPIKEGMTVTVVKKNGESKSETVGKVVWSGDGVWLATIRKSDTSSDRPRRDPNAPGRNGMMPGCAACSRLGRMCKSCAFDEYDS